VLLIFDVVIVVIRLLFVFIINQSDGQLSLPHVTNNEYYKEIKLKLKTDEQISPVNGLEPWDQSDRQKQTKVEDKIFWKGRF